MRFRLAAPLPRVQLAQSALAASLLLASSAQCLRALPTPVRNTLVRALVRHPVIFAAYPKTGVTLSRSLLGIPQWIGGIFRRPEEGLCHYPEEVDLSLYDHSGGWCASAASCAFSCGDFWTAGFELNASSLPMHFVVAPSSRWSMPAGARMVHWIRDPLALVLSSYRYHWRDRNPAEEWEGWPAVCSYCSGATRANLFHGCDYRCSYVDLLHGLGTRRGILASAVMASDLLNHMAVNMRRWARHPEHLWLDYNGTMRCMLRFLGLDDEALLGHLQAFDPSAGTYGHSTAGSFDNGELRGFLENTTWGPFFARAREAARKLFAMQQRRHGCPQPFEA